MEAAFAGAGIDQLRPLWRLRNRHGRRSLWLQVHRMGWRASRCHIVSSHTLQAAQVARLGCYGEGRSHLSGPPGAREAGHERGEIGRFGRNAGRCLAIGQCRQVCLHGPHLLQKLQRIEGAGDFAQLRFRGFWHALRLQQALTGRLRRMVALGDLSAFTMFCSQFERGLEEVHEQPRGAIQARDRLRGRDTLKAPIPEKLAHDSAVLLLDPSLVVLAIGARAGELDPMA